MATGCSFPAAARCPPVSTAAPASCSTFSSARTSKKGAAPTSPPTPKLFFNGGQAFTADEGHYLEGLTFGALDR